MEITGIKDLDNIINGYKKEMEHIINYNKYKREIKNVKHISYNKKTNSYISVRNKIRKCSYISKGHNKYTQYAREIDIKTNKSNLIISSKKKSYIISQNKITIYEGNKCWSFIKYESNDSIYYNKDLYEKKINYLLTPTKHILNKLVKPHLLLTEEEYNNI